MEVRGIRKEPFPSAKEAKAPTSRTPDVEENEPSTNATEEENEPLTNATEEENEPSTDDTLISRIRALEKENKFLTDEISKMETILEKPEIVFDESENQRLLDCLDSRRNYDFLRSLFTENKSLSYVVKESGTKSKKDIEFQRKVLPLINGIVFHKVTHCPEVDTSLVVKRRFDLHGISHGLTFWVQFIATTDTELRVVQTIIKLQSEISDAINSFLHKVTSTNNIMLFFNSFRIFAEEVEKRKRFFLDLRKKYNKNVTIINYCGPFAIIESNVRPVELVFEWSISLDEFGNLLQQHNMFPKISRYHILHDTKHRIELIPELFTQLLQMKGLKKAVEIMIDTIMQPPNPRKVQYKKEENWYEL